MDAKNILKMVLTLLGVTGLTIEVTSKDPVTFELRYDRAGQSFRHTITLDALRQLLSDLNQGP